ncbi:MAG: hypothetical protein J6U87_05485, partial [Clostridia bacterium]|nr:hypothetical protein [Clostridia bacterium]
KIDKIKGKYKGLIGVAAELVKFDKKYEGIVYNLLGRTVIVDDMDTTKSKEVFKRFGSVIEVPQTRFYTGITLNSGASAWGYTKATDAVGINFLVVAKSAVVQAKKLALPKIFTPDENQTKDAWKFQYRLYHDALAYDNKKTGIYVHKAV